MNSAVLVGCMNICPTNWFLSITSDVLFVSSITTLKANKPCLCCTDARNGLTCAKKLFLVAAVFCSNTRLSDTCEMKDLRLINNLLTFTLSNADALCCNVFWPNTTTPLPGKVAIGLTFPT